MLILRFSFSEISDVLSSAGFPEYKLAKFSCFPWIEKIYFHAFVNEKFVKTMKIMNLRPTASTTIVSKM